MIADRILDLIRLNNEIMLELVKLEQMRIPPQEVKLMPSEEIDLTELYTDLAGGALE